MIASLHWRRMVIAAVAIASSIHAIYLIQNASFDREAAQSRTTLLERQLIETQQKLANHAQFAAQLNDMRGPLTRLEERLPTRLNRSAIEASVRAQAALAHIEITGLHFGAETIKEGFYAEATLSLTVQGTTADFFAFMDQMLRVSPLRRVAEMRVEPIEGTTARAVLTVMFDHFVDLEP
jgi:Tfp pilus assembly protein PilO